MRGQRSALGEDRRPNNVSLLALGFVVFWIGGGVFQKGATDDAPSGAAAVLSLGVHALNVGGVVLMIVGGCLMLAAGII